MKNYYVLIGVIVGIIVLAFLVVGGYNLESKKQIEGYAGEKINVSLQAAPKHLLKKEFIDSTFKLVNYPHFILNSPS